MTTNTLKFFTLLRFPLMVGVVMIHCDISDQLVPELRGQWAQDVMYFFSNIIGRFSVPMFFLISGFLFYRNGTLTHNEYASKLHHRQIKKSKNINYVSFCHCNYSRYDYPWGNLSLFAT